VYDGAAGLLVKLDATCILVTCDGRDEFGGFD
jgi:hypothetical protein